MTDDPNPTKSNSQGITDDAVSHAADVGKTLIGGITPADKGWILGFICVVFIIVASDMWISIKTLQRQSETSRTTSEFFMMIEQNRASQFREAMSQWADQTRRYQEVIRALTESVARDAERAGQAAVSAIDDKVRQQYLGEDQ